MLINVIGLGYVGLPTALMLSSNGYSVVGSDINEELVNALKGKTYFSGEKRYEELREKSEANGIEYTSEYAKADIYIVTVPTPYNKVTKRVNVVYIIQAIERILNTIDDKCIIVIESTIPPHTIDNEIRPLINENEKGHLVKLAYAPERVLPGDTFAELENNPRVIGVDDTETGNLLKKIYSSFAKNEIIITDIITAEMTKVVENTYRDVNIAYANELARICREGDMDVNKIIDIANMHPRVHIHNPGPGVGGHCISVDPWFLVGDYPGLTNLILTARNINDSMPEYILGRIQEIVKKHDISSFTDIGIYGLTYKENINDTRESPTLKLLESIENHMGNPPLVFDPYISDNITKNQTHDYTEFLLKTKVIIVMVGHDQILENIDLLKNKIILDTKNILPESDLYERESL